MAIPPLKLIKGPTADDFDAESDDDSPADTTQRSGASSSQATPSQSPRRSPKQSPRNIFERSLLQRYGVGHHVRRASITRIKPYESTETDPRWVANGTLQKLRAGPASQMLIDELKSAFLGTHPYVLPTRGRCSVAAQLAAQQRMTRRQHDEEMESQKVQMRHFVRRLGKFLARIEQRSAAEADLVHKVPFFRIEGDDEGAAQDPLSIFSREDDTVVNDTILHECGFEALFQAIDCESKGWILWKDFLAYLMDAAMLARGISREEDGKMYDLTHSHSSSAFVEASQVIYVPSRQQFIVAGVDVVFLDKIRGYPKRAVIHTPANPVTQTNNYKPSSTSFIEPWGILAVSCTDSVIRFYLVGPGNRTKYLTEVRCAANVTAMLYEPLRQRLYLGTREGELISLLLKYRPSVGLEPVRVCASTPHKEAITTIAYVSTEKAIATGSYDRLIVLQDARTHKFIRKITCHRAAILAMVHWIDGNTIISAGFDQEPLVSLVATQVRAPCSLSDKAHPHIAPVYALELLEVHSAVASMDMKGIIKIWDLKSLNCIQTLTCELAKSTDPTNRFISMFHIDCTIDVEMPMTGVFAFSKRRLFALEYNASQFAAARRHIADEDAILAVVYNYFDKTFVTVSSLAVRTWDTRTSALRDVFRCAQHAANGGIISFALSTTGKLFYIGTINGSLFCHSSSTGSIIHSAIRAHDGAIVSIACCTSVKYRVTWNYVTAISADKVTVRPPDFTTYVSLSDVDHARCLDFCEVSGTMVIGESMGRLVLYLAENISLNSIKPHAILTFPKPTPHDVTACKVLGGLSVVAAGDDQGHIALFGLRFFDPPYACVALWTHCSDMETIPSIAAFGCYNTKWILYAGDDRGFVTAYDLRGLMKRVGHTANIAAERRKSRQSVQLQRKDSTFSTLSLSATFQLSGTFSPDSIQKRRGTMSPAEMAEFITQQSNLADTTREVIVLNRWRAHADTVTAITLRLDGTHATVITGSADQSVVGWSLAGGVFFGALCKRALSGIRQECLSVADDVDRFDPRCSENSKHKPTESGDPVASQIPPALLGTLSEIAAASSGTWACFSESSSALQSPLSLKSDPIRVHVPHFLRRAGLKGQESATYNELLCAPAPPPEPEKKSKPEESERSIPVKQCLKGAKFPQHLVPTAADTSTAPLLPKEDIEEIERARSPSQRYGLRTFHSGATSSGCARAIEMRPIPIPVLQFEDPSQQDQSRANAPREQSGALVSVGDTAHTLEEAVSLLPPTELGVAAKRTLEGAQEVRNLLAAAWRPSAPMESYVYRNSVVPTAADESVSFPCMQQFKIVVERSPSQYVFPGVKENTRKPRPHDFFSTSATTIPRPLSALPSVVERLKMPIHTRSVTPCQSNSISDYRSIRQRTRSLVDSFSMPSSHQPPRLRFGSWVNTTNRKT